MIVIFIPEEYFLRARNESDQNRFRIERFYDTSKVLK